jgi:hypothetical protein
VIVPFQDMQPGMVIAEDVRSAGYTLLLARGYEVTHLLLDRLPGLPAEVRTIPVIEAAEATGSSALPDAA